MGAGQRRAVCHGWAGCGRPGVSWTRRAGQGSVGAGWGPEIQRAPLFSVLSTRRTQGSSIPVSPLRAQGSSRPPLSPASSGRLLPAVGSGEGAGLSLPGSTTGEPPGSSPLERSLAGTCFSVSNQKVTSRHKVRGCGPLKTWRGPQARMTGPASPGHGGGGLGAPARPQPPPPVTPSVSRAVPVSRGPQRTQCLQLRPGRGPLCRATASLCPR